MKRKQNKRKNKDLTIGLSILIGAAICLAASYLVRSQHIENKKLEGREDTETAQYNERPVEKCGGRYAFAGEKVQVIGADTMFGLNIIAFTGPALANATEPLPTLSPLLSEDDIKLFRTASTKVVNLDCDPRQLQEIQAKELVELYFDNAKAHEDARPALIVTQ